ncbi:MAG: phosphoglucosamine mutase [Proteobacteria bacterium]|nr:phosphoglucosamine mutase [Pseudomonadota bacterium]
MTRKYFGTDGIRGRANAGLLTAATAMKVGQAAGRHFLRGSHKHRVVIGKDTRLSGYMMETALVSGFTSVGMDVILTGPLPTPAIALLTREMRADLGVMISASHNPFADNGIKLFGPDGFKLSDEDELAIEKAMGEDIPLAQGEAIGRARRIEDARGRYIHAIKQSLPDLVRLDGLKIVVDCANGAAYTVAPSAIWELGAEVIAIGVEPNGLNINDGVGSTALDALKARVVAEDADIGIALDGDADRLIVIDETGATVDGDQIMAGSIAALQVLAALVQSGKKASELLHLFDPVPQLLKNVHYAGGAPLEDAAVKAVIAEAEAALQGKGRLVIRPSGTEPVIRVMAEGDDEKQVKQVVADICAAVEAAA